MTVTGGVTSHPINLWFQFARDIKEGRNGETDEANFWWPCWSYQACQLKQKRAVLSFCHLRYQQGWCYRTCLVWMEADDVAVTQGEFNASVAHRLHLSVNPKRNETRVRKEGREEGLGDWSLSWLSTHWHWGCDVLSWWCRGCCVSGCIILGLHGGTGVAGWTISGPLVQ